LNKVNIIGHRVESTHQVNANISHRAVILKYDTGAKCTVISVGMFDDSLTETDLQKFTAFCEEHCPDKYKENFISATGDLFKGYLVTAHNVKMGNTTLQEFRYYLVVENKRDIALVGFDFIDKCNRYADAYGDIHITEFDEDGYGSLDGSMENDEVIAFIDSLSA